MGCRWSWGEGQMVQWKHPAWAVPCRETAQAVVQAASHTSCFPLKTSRAWIARGGTRHTPRTGG